MAVAGDAQSSAAAAIMLTSGASGRLNALFSPRIMKSLLMLMTAFLMLLVAPFRGRISRVASSSSSPSLPAEEKCRDEKKIEKGGTSGSGHVSQRKKVPVVVRVPANVPWKSSSTVLAAAVDQDVATRRAIAIQRVVRDGDEKTFTDFSFHVTVKGETLFTQSWSPVSMEIRGLVVIMHGLNEHSGRYSKFAKLLNVNGYKVYGIDWIGHGGSDGLHAYIHSLDDVVTDTKSLINKVVADNPGLPCFCFGHSTGGAIILKTVLDPKIEACISGIVLTSPAIGFQPIHPILTMVAPVLSMLFPRYQVSAANKEGEVVSRDPKALADKYSDPLVYTGSIRVRTAFEVLRISASLQQNLRRVTVPFLVLHGTADGITDPLASQKLFDEASATDKSIQLLDGLLHDLLFEPEGEMIANGIVDWLNERVEKRMR
ncbi:monoacylglycerol lipase-like [Impatiens glandulifera]|uniref:monoacylglycerol lipase-like n=1 Tax=Impatiens glandulifera TaxID=253017 RepID=UPI001FB1328B|nr:monoacylglycerol lipase-like [Impatiens glandulifera]